MIDLNEIPIKCPHCSKEHQVKNDSPIIIFACNNCWRDIKVEINKDGDVMVTKYRFKYC